MIERWTYLIGVPFNLFDDLELWKFLEERNLLDMGIRHRIAPRDTMPEHSVEIGYLRDLTVAIKVVVHNIPASPYLPVLDTDMFAAWSMVHRANLAQCEGFKRGQTMFSEDLHADEVARIDALIDKLKCGLNEGNAVKYVSETDIEQLERDYRALDVCQRKTVWY